MKAAILWGLFLIFAFLAFASYMRITVILRAIDKQANREIESRAQLQDKLRAYRDWCRENDSYPFLLILFAISVVAAVICWIPLPWLIYT
ncbi:hypothetical protein JW979_02475 [bacterium]|nr:hypothetical protein [candidate division CSSED10-310 bacterium]